MESHNSRIHIMVLFGGIVCACGLFSSFGVGFSLLESLGDAEKKQQAQCSMITSEGDAISPPKNLGP